MPETSQVLTDAHEGVLTITLNQPAQLQRAFDGDDACELTAALRAAERDDACG